MSIQVALHHRTTYRYDRPVTLGPQVIRLRPAPHCRTPLHHYSLRIEPQPHFLNWQQDALGNYLARVVFPEKIDSMVIEVGLRAELTAINPFDFFLEPQAVNYPFSYAPAFRRAHSGYFRRRPPAKLTRALIQSLKLAGERRTIDYLIDINRKVHELVRYVIRLEPGIQTCETTLRTRRGSCRDSAWLLVELLRHLGFAARFVSGYLVQLAPDVKSLDGPSGADRDFTDLHAWAEVYLPGAGWVGLDATSGLLAGEGHIPLACAADPADAAPLSGAVDQCETTFDVQMSVTRLDERARVTKPYTDEQWARIDRLGAEVDERLARGDVRLTMGGEPTFVSIDDMDGDEWNMLAQGPVKRARAGDLIKRLRQRFAPGALLHYGVGKWYPGESLPRWALTCAWRRDGEPLWRDDQWIADEGQDLGHDPGAAQKFIHRLAERLGVSTRHVMPGHEDAWYYLWRERRLPANIDPLDSKLKDPEERARLARVFERGLDHIVGYALPLRAITGGSARWMTGPWFLRPETLFLIPGDSPMGLRLPLDSLPWVRSGDDSPMLPPDPLQPLPPLPVRTRTEQQRDGIARGAAFPGHDAVRRPGPRESASWIVRTALCVEPREGRLYVFMPPVPGLEDYLELVASIEDTAAELRLPVIIEGYPPPSDLRLNSFKVTPDPGVIEVNLQPALGWQELNTLMTGLYEEARLARLGTEKFMLDGRHSGTGGGNHIVMGGATPADSPFLRRPDLLRSLLNYWHNHPSLSYLFSGLFIGPTSQAPRADEARNDSIYELEIAFRQLGQQGAPPWWTDRALRNLLVDVTGNTHRTEFCIDKLYAPETADGRRGLVELRSFEMPPHARMSLAQQLLVRALIARFWEKPYQQSLVRWGTELHDRFMLPFFVWDDFSGVVEDLRQDGLAFEPRWFEPHFEFRFPVLGEIECRGMRLDVRQAIEPWLALGEEPGVGGAVRYVDSSVERIQVHASGLVGDRHIVTCNGLALPLCPTGRVGEYVAGVRYRAWQPPSCLHPQIGVHTPLVFDLVDTWNERSLGGCTYHVSHPGGLAHQKFPVNALEAEGRRFARFLPFGHTAGPVRVQRPDVSREFPMTLDLRRARPV